MILVDSNIPMYVVGASSRHKLDAQSVLERALSAGERLVTDAQVLQEICHRYAAIGRKEAIQPAFDTLLRAVDDVLPVERVDVERAKDVVLQYSGLSTRDAIHLAVMRHHGIERIMTFDTGFDAHSDVERVH